MKTKLTIHKIAQIDRLLSATVPGVPPNTHLRVQQRINQGATFGHGVEASRVHGYRSAWSEIVRRNLHTA